MFCTDGEDDSDERFKRNRKVHQVVQMTKQAVKEGLYLSRKG